jgi:hypothetical protein
MGFGWQKRAVFPFNIPGVRRRYPKRPNRHEISRTAGFTEPTMRDGLGDSRWAARGGAHGRLATGRLRDVSSSLGVRVAFRPFLPTEPCREIPFPAATGSPADPCIAPGSRPRAGCHICQVGGPSSSLALASAGRQSPSVRARSYRCPNSTVRSPEIGYAAAGSGAACPSGRPWGARKGERGGGQGRGGRRPPIGASRGSWALLGAIHASREHLAAPGAEVGEVERLEGLLLPAGASPGDPVEGAGDAAAAAADGLP